MSFTLIRYKDGKEIPIKVSVLDAFRSASSRRPKAIQPEKKPETKVSPVTSAQSPKPVNDNNSSNDINNTNNSSDRAEESYSAEDDAKIIAMKAIPGTSWNDIKEAISKQSLWQLKEHYKLHLGPNAEAEQKKAAARAIKAEKIKAEGLAKQAEDGKRNAAGEESGSGASGEGDGTKNKKNKGNGDDDAKAGEKKGKGKENANGASKAIDTAEKLSEKNLQAFVKKYERDKWLAAASRHYDLTGQRISAEVAKKMAERK